MPKGLHLINSNHMEVLASALAEVLGTPPGTGSVAAFQPDIVLVQSKGMQRWISMAVAQANGICANVQFPFPNAFIQQLCNVVEEAAQATGAYEKQVLAFRILHLLPGLLDQADFDPLSRYLANDDRPIKRYQLCRKLADALDQYAVFRPDWLFVWEEERGNIGKLPETQRWQAHLWRALRSEQSGVHRSALQKRLVEVLSDPVKEIGHLPARVSVFGISHLPPFHLQVLEALSQRIPVYLFLLNPCRQYWSDIVSDQQMIRIRSRGGTPLDNEALYLERGNRLLATLGAQGKQFFDFIHQCQAHHHEAFRENQHDQLLGRIQQDILDLVDPQVTEAKADTESVRADGTLRVHNCHSPMREIEVLHDQLLDMLDCIPGLQPREILVMAPHIGTYAPFIHAVFGSSDAMGTQLPYSVADQSILRENATIDAFIQLLDMTGGRLASSRVLNLLSCRAVHTRFGLCETDLPVIHRWVRAAGVRWGWDGVDRQRHGLPGFRQNTWREGLDRLLLGFSMAQVQGRLFKGTLPFEEMVAGEGETLGRFTQFVEALSECNAMLHTSDTLDGWGTRLFTLFDRFFLVGQQDEREVQPLRSVIDQMIQIGQMIQTGQMVSTGQVVQTGSHPSHQRELSFEVIRQYVKDMLNQSTRESGFMAGGITFCAMLPMRSIPFKVICLLGMNHDAFPRENREPGFNLIGAEPRPGDRSKRNDDRYLFLETLISARHIFYMSYVGQSIQDNSAIPPSVVVDELIEYVGEGYGISLDESVVRHPLHAFSAAYFSGETPHLFSYSKANCDAAEALVAPGPIQQLFSVPLPDADHQWQQCDWSGLGKFWTHPIKHLMQHRLGIRLGSGGDALEDRESFKLNALERYQLNQQLLRSFSEGASIHEAYRIARAANLLPHGAAGKVQCEQQADEVLNFLQTLDGILPKNTPRSILIEKEITPFSVQGEIDRVYPQGRIVYRMGKARGKDLLSLFVSHLALHFCEDREVARFSTLVCEDKIWQVCPLEKADDILYLFLDLYWQGLHGPLPFYCQSSFTYAYQVIINQRSPFEALTYAEQAWNGNPYVPGEADDPYHRLCFRRQHSFSEDFQKMALQIFEPLLSSAQVF